MPPTRSFAANLHRHLYVSPYPRNRTESIKQEKYTSTTRNADGLSPNVNSSVPARLCHSTSAIPCTPPLLPTSFALLDLAPNFNPECITRALSQSLAKGTRKNYESAVKSYLDFCDKIAVRTDLRFPADERILCAFVASLVASMAGSSISGLLSGLKLWHSAHNMEWRGSQRLNLLVKAASINAPPSSKRAQRDPITLDMLSALAKNLDLDSPRDAAIFAAALIAFWGQCRLGELLGSSSLRFDQTSLPTKGAVATGIDADTRTIALPRTKTNRADGQSIIILRQLAPYDPIAALDNHFRINAKVGTSNHLFAFIPSPHLSPRCLTKEVFLARCNEIWRSCGWERFTGHSFRIGGTTTLLRNNVAPDIVRELGRWSSDAFFRYWRDTQAIAAKHAKLIGSAPSRAPTLRGRATAPLGAARVRAIGRSTRQSTRALA